MKITNLRNAKKGFIYKVPKVIPQSWDCDRTNNSKIAIIPDFVNVNANPNEIANATNQMNLKYYYYYSTTATLI